MTQKVFNHTFSALCTELWNEPPKRLVSLVYTVRFSCISRRHSSYNTYLQRRCSMSCCLCVTGLYYLSFKMTKVQPKTLMQDFGMSVLSIESKFT